MRTRFLLRFPGLLAAAVLICGLAAPGPVASPGDEKAAKSEKEESQKKAASDKGKETEARKDADKKGTAERAEKKDTAGTKDAANKTTKKKPRVFTNADLAKYAKTSRTAPRVVQTVPAAEPGGPAEPPAVGSGKRIGLPEDNVESATLPELEEERTQLSALLRYLEAKAAWLKNPLLPAPTPPYGEELLDPQLSGAQELQLTQTRIRSTRGRLQKVEARLSGAGTTP